MVKRNILEKMSDRELLQYLRSDSRFVAQALEIAFDILKKRDYQFTKIEEKRIDKLIEAKRNHEPDYSLVNQWDIDEDAEKAKVSFYSQKSIWLVSVLLGTFTGAILLAINFFQVSKPKKGLLTLLFATFHIMVFYIIHRITQIYLMDFNRIISFGFNGLGAAVLQFWFWDKYLKGVKYKKRNVWVPVLLTVCFYVVVYSLFLLVRIE